MGYSVAGWCYASLAEAADALMVVRSIDSTHFVTTGVTVSSPNLIVAGTFFNGTSNLAKTVTVGVPVCSEVGPLPGFSGMGLTVADAAQLSFLVIGVWVAAYAFRAMRMGLMQ